MGLKILFEDEQIMVVKKDAGIPVQAGKLRMMDLQGLILVVQKLGSEAVHMVQE